jgi:G:T-mismatch repair DNA endonuclease (very short patch repair protein)
MVILEEETYRKFGYYPQDLKSHSHKSILVACDDCGGIREIRKDKYSSFCRKCTAKGKKNPSWKGGKVLNVCLVCGNEFMVKPSRRKKGWGKYCSRKCQGIAYSKERAGDRTWAWKGGPIKRICPICKKSFFVRQSQIVAGKGKYCSRECMGRALSKMYIKEKAPMWNGGPVQRNCLVCDKIFYAEKNQIKKGLGKYCSLSCATKARMHNAKPKKTKPELIFEEMCIMYNLPFHFIGDGSLWLGNSNPDFIHNTRKLVCEIFGDYWHSPLLNKNIRYTSTLDGRRKQLKAEGYNLIVFWESDLKRKDAEAFVLYTLEKHNIFPSTT